MAGKTIYLVYDNKIEDEKSLQDFMTRILKNAGFDLANLYLLDHNKVDSVISEDEHQYYICINNTYVNSTLKISRSLNITPHRFFSRFYRDEDKKVIVLGLIHSIDEMLSGDKTTKLNVWEKVKDFLATYKDYTDTTDNVEEVIVEDEQPVTIQEELVLEDKEEVVSIIPVVEKDIVGTISNIEVSTISVGELTDLSATSINFEIIYNLPYEEKIELLSKLQMDIFSQLRKGVYWLIINT